MDTASLLCFSIKSFLIEISIIDVLRYLVMSTFCLIPPVPEDTLMFWKGIADVGLMEEVVCNIQKEIEELLRGVQQRLLQAPFQVTGKCTEPGTSLPFFERSQLCSGSCSPHDSEAEEPFSSFYR